MKEKYNFRTIEERWQKYWTQHKMFAPRDHSSKPSFYLLEMFPYPSGTLHMGHARNYTIGDVRARYHWAKGYEVMHPMGWDACGLPAENAALQKNVHPRVWTMENARIMKQQCQSMGFSHDWEREIFSCDPEYFCHEQKMFLDFYKQGLAYRKESYVNWDPVDQSVLANEQVIDGRGWRSGAVVEQKLMSQWFLRITSFADELLEGLQDLSHWPEMVKQMQTHWIGRSQGALINFSLAQEPTQKIAIFTTRPETLYGATFCALAWNHPLIQQWSDENGALAVFAQSCQQRGSATALLDTEEKKGVFSGYYARHPLLPEVLLPIYAVNYVVMDYGTGAIFGCPAHDARDAEFARAHDLPFLSVIEEDKMVASQDLSGLDVLAARQRILDQLEQLGLGQRKKMYRLRDWGISRQRYWGVPIPIIYCKACGVVPVPAEDLPVTLPEDVVFDGSGNPLERHPTWKDTSCPKCRGAAQRETDTFDTFFESSWYFARFCDAANNHMAFDPEKIKRWMPVNEYIGGIEHAVLHLLYARFFTRALRQCGYWDLSEPFTHLFTQGMVCHKTFRSTDGQWLTPQDVDPQKKCRLSDGSPVQVGSSEKMSKSKCNVVSVTDMVQTYGADAMRLFLISDTPPQYDLEWTDQGIAGAWRYVRRVWDLVQNKWSLCREAQEPKTLSAQAMALQRALHKAIASATTHLENYGLNKYIADIRELSNKIADYHPQEIADAWVLQQALKTFIVLMAPVMPHLAEELGELLGFAPGIHLSPWPSADPAFLQETHCTLSIQINGRMRGTLRVALDTPESELKELVKQKPDLSVYLLPSEQQNGEPWTRFISIPNRSISIVTAL